MTFGTNCIPCTQHSISVAELILSLGSLDAAFWASRVADAVNNVDHVQPVAVHLSP